MHTFDDKLREYDEFIRIISEFRFFLNPSHLIKFVSQCSNDELIEWTSLLHQAENLQLKFQDHNAAYEELYQFNAKSKKFFDQLLLAPYEKEATDVITSIKNKMK